MGLADVIGGAAVGTDFLLRLLTALHKVLWWVRAIRSDLDLHRGWLDLGQLFNSPVRARIMLFVIVIWGSL